MIESYLYGDTLLSASQLLKYQTQILTSITLNDFKSRAKIFNEQTKLTTAFLQNTKTRRANLIRLRFFRDQNLVIQKQQLQRWVQETSRTKLMERPHSRVHRRRNSPDEFGDQQIQNFLMVLKSGKRNRIQGRNKRKFLMRKQGGTALASDDQYFSARYAASMLYSLGLADLDQTQVTEVLAGKQYQL